MKSKAKATTVINQVPSISRTRSLFFSPHSSTPSWNRLSVAVRILGGKGIASPGASAGIGDLAAGPAAVDGIVQSSVVDTTVGRLQLIIRVACKC